MKKITYQTCSDIAFIKYWGQKDSLLYLPENGSISMSLDSLITTTTVNFDENLTSDEVMIDGKTLDREIVKAQQQLDRIRELAGISTKAKVVSKNSFPRSTGLSSSASGFAALTLAATEALDLKLSQKELSILARRSSSGSASRCVMGGFVEWLEGDDSESSYAYQLHPSSHWDISDIVVIVDRDAKNVSSVEGHLSAQTSPFFKTRQGVINSKIKKMKSALENKNFTILGELIEAEALEFHAILLTSNPALIAWYPGTLAVIHAVKNMRKQGIEAYFSINTGFNLHILTLKENAPKVKKIIDEIDFVKSSLISSVGNGPKHLNNHLF